LNKALAHADCIFDDSPFLIELAAREENIKTGRLTSILFLRYQKQKKEISGYIDLAHRMKTENFKKYFEKPIEILLPKPTDLSYYNWESLKAYANESPNFRVDANSEVGLLFRNKRDRKVINVDPQFVKLIRIILLLMNLQILKKEQRKKVVKKRMKAIQQELLSNPLNMNKLSFSII